MNDSADAAALAELQKQGVGLVALRCAGFDCVDVEAAARLGIKVLRVPTYSPPSVAELKAMLGAQGGELRKLFNVSGMDYRSLGLKDTLPGMSTEEALGLLAGNGNLVKRPFAIDAGKKVFLVGFKEAEWEGALGK